MVKYAATILFVGAITTLVIVLSNRDIIERAVGDGVCDFAWQEHRKYLVRRIDGGVLLPEPFCSTDIFVRPCREFELSDGGFEIPVGVKCRL